MDILGYSERGMVSSLFYEIAYSDKSKELISDLIREISLVGDKSGIPVKGVIKECKVLIEQSFSGFGDPDVLLFVTLRGEDKGFENKLSIFIEAKVKTDQRNFWTIKGEWKRFSNGLKIGEYRSSNLFGQIYLKEGFTDALKDDNIEDGVEFDVGSTRKLCKIGTNRVVLKATNLLKNYDGKVYYVVIVPDDTESVKAFLEGPEPEECPFKWNKFRRHLGYITWKQIHEFSKINNLNRTLKAFEHNEGQIYRNLKGTK